MSSEAVAEEGDHRKIMDRGHGVRYGGRGAAERYKRGADTRRKVAEDKQIPCFIDKQAKKRWTCVMDAGVASAQQYAGSSTGTAYIISTP